MAFGSGFGFGYSNNIRIIKSVQSSAPITGLTSIEIASSQLIKGGTIQSGDMFYILYRGLKTGVNAGVQYRIYINTSINLLGASSLGFFNSATASNTWMQTNRTYFVKSASVTQYFPSGGNLINDISASVGFTELNVDWTIDQYIMFTIQNGSALDSTIISGYHINIF